MMVRTRFLPLILALAATSACSQNPVVSSSTGVQPVAKLDVVAEKSEAKPAEEKLPAQPLTPDVLYEFLVSEIAGQRGMMGTAKEGYLDLAEKTRDPRFAKRAAEIAIFSRDQAAALKAVKLWVKLEPESTSANRTMAALLINQGKIDQAAPYLEKYLEQAHEPEVFLHLPMLFARAKEPEKALNLMEKLVQGYPQSAEAKYALAQVAASFGQMDKALAALSAADELRPGWELAALMRARILAHRSKSESLDFMKQFLTSHPQARDIRLAYARLLVDSNQFVEARKQFKQLMDEVPDNPDITLASGLLALQMADLDEGERLLVKARDLGYKEPDTISYYLGQVAEERKQDDKALSLYQSVNNGEFVIPARSREAAILARQGKLAEARKLLNETPTLNDEQSIQLVQAEANLLREAHDYEGAYKVLSQALAKFPDALDLLYDHAMAAEKTNRLDVMEQDLRKVIRIKPDYAQAYNALGYTLADRTNRLDEAEALLDKALSLSPDDPYILDSVGWLQYRKGNLAKSQEYLERAYKIRPDPEIAAHLGEVLWMMGAKEAADKLWHASLQSNPQSEALIETLKKFSKP
jgi:tetratricopeptide (TPR) repeat protein